MSKKNSGNRRFLSLILSILMIFTTIPLDAYATEATDISNHWAQDTIESWMDKGLAKGYPDGSFKPDNNITRAEFVAMVNRAFGYTLTAPISYSDVKLGAWYYNSMEIAVAKGYIGGYPDGKIKPENPITREEAAALLMKMNKLMENKSAANVFTDAVNFSWSKGAIGAVFEAGLIGGYPDGSFGNRKFIKRGEAVVVLDRNLKYVRGLTPKLSIAVTGKDTTSDPEKTLSAIADEVSSGSGGGGGGGGGGVSASQAAPTGLTGVAPTTSANNDGKITGTTVAMEYKLASASTWIRVTGTEITGLEAGIYEVRYAAKEGYSVGAKATATVPSYIKPVANQVAPTTLAGLAPSTAGGSDGSITGTRADMEYRSSADETWIPVTGTEITGLAAGWYDVRYAAKEGYNAGAIATVTVPAYVTPLANQEAPTTLAGVSPSTVGGTDGKIIRTTDDMEYRSSADETWIRVTGTEITGLAAGIYEVRYAAKEGYNAGEIATVTVSANQSAPDGLVGVAPTKFAGTDGKITGTTADMEYRLLEEGTITTWIQATETEITGLSSGWYDVRYAAKEGYNPGTETQVIVPQGINQEQLKPDGLVGVAPTAVGGTDGKITGTTADMEYRLLEEGTSWIQAKEPEITGLAAGWYDVRYAAKEGYNAGPAVTVQIQVPKGSDATLNALAIDGILLKGFASGLLVYNIELPLGTTTVPTVTATATDSNAPVVISPASSLPGSTTILVTADDGINTQTYTINFILTNKVPIDLKGIAPSTVGGSNGKITRTTADMEYRLPAGETWIPVTGTEIIGLVAGIYEVRYAAKEGYSVGAPANVVVPNPNSGKLIFTFDDGWKDTIDLGKPILDTAGFKATVYVNRDVAQAAEYEWSSYHVENVMDYDDLHELYDNGWDVSNHSTNHLDYKRNADGLLVDVNNIPLEWQTPEAYGAAHPEISEERWYEAWLSTLVAIGSDSSSIGRLKEVYEANQYWLSNSGPDGLGKLINEVWTPGENLNMPLSAYHVAYPSGLYSDELITALQSIGTLTGRATIDNNGNYNIVTPDFFRLPVQYVETQLVNGKDENLVDVLASIDSAVENGSTIILMLHRVGPVGDLYVTPESFQSIVNYAKASADLDKLDVMTMSQWYNAMK